MKKFLFAFFLLIILQAPIPTFAHDLLPKQIVEYLASHPDATAEEIQAYAQTQDRAVASQFSSEEAVIRLVRNQHTNIWDNTLDFVVLGVKHILSGPDHILFVLSILLVFGSVRELVKLTSTFTIAHSITLFLAGAGLVTLSARIVEPVIALSIAFMPIITVFGRNSRFIANNRGKIVLIFIFGLFHGFGFAGLLEEIAIPKNRFLSSLFGFNIGIEIGQIIIVTLLLPFIFLLKKKSWYEIFIKLFAVCISILAFFWVIQRIFVA